MRALISSLVFLATGLSPLAAQYEPDTAHCSVSDVFISFGGQVEGGGWISLSEVRAAAPGSQLLDRDLSGYDLGRGFAVGQAASLFNAALGLDLKHDRGRGTSTKLRVGIGSAKFNSAPFTLQRTDRRTVDTLVSNSTGTTVYLDSVTTRNITVDRSYQRISGNAALLFVKDYPGHWTLFAGGELQVGADFNGITRVRYREERFTETSEWTRDRSRERDLEEENFRNNGAMFGAAYLPFGFGYRISKRHPFWRTSIFTMEMRPGLTFGGDPAGVQDVRTSFGVLCGWRIDLENSALVQGFRQRRSTIDRRR